MLIQHPFRFSQHLVLCLCILIFSVSSHARQAQQQAAQAWAYAEPSDEEKQGWRPREHFFDAEKWLKTQFYDTKKSARTSAKSTDQRLPVAQLDTRQIPYRFEILNHQQYLKTPSADAAKCPVRCILLNGHIFSDQLTILNSSWLKEVGRFIYADHSVHIIDMRNHQSQYYGGIGFLSIQNNQINFNYFDGFRKAVGNTMYRIHDQGLEVKMDDGTYQSVIRFDQKGFHQTELTPYPLTMQSCTEKKGKWVCEMAR
ncbi:hypothetical protein [Acinetobacter chinensis]|uniref:hypothetical protein n=1 Tax=Acinetobacter chinensis TaxID=2004650 RepID=UPI0029351FF7|nr:hypothetical protein [Acinetobacter chinensis]WOE42403.1 hypothetical protein QSG87_04485 [Acinetobacter chinensis]